MPWQVSSLIFILLSAFRSVQSRRIGLYKRDVTIYAMVASFVCVFLTGLIFAVISWDSVNHGSAREAWAFLLLGGLLFSLINLLVLKLFRHVPASVAMFMSLFNTLSVVVFAVFFANETLSPRQWLGAVIILTAVVIVGFVSHRTSKNKKNLNIIFGSLLALVVALMFGPATINEKYLIQRLGLETYLLYGWAAQALLSTTIALLYSLRSKSKKSLQITPVMHRNVWAYGVMLGLSGLFFVLSLRDSGSASLTTVATTSRVALTVIFAYFMLKEKQNVRLKLAGLVLSSIGLGLLFY